MNEYVQIGYGQLGLASLLIVINLVLSFLLRLSLGRRLVVAALRMTVQLLLVGLVLEWIFSINRPLPILSMALAMAALAGIAAVNRTRRRFPGIYWNSLVSVLTASFLVTGLALTGILRIDPWFVRTPKPGLIEVVHPLRG